MDDQKKTRVRPVKSERSETELKAPASYNEIRLGIADSVNSKFSTSSIATFEMHQTETVTNLMVEFEEDTAVPEDLDLLYNFNASLNVTEAKWLRRYNTYNKALSLNQKKLEVLESTITQEYKRNPDVHNGLLINDKEIRNLIVINVEHIELEEKIANVKAILSVIEKAMARIDSMSYRIGNAINILRIKHTLQW